MDTCEMDGCWYDQYDNEHYWHCEEEATQTVNGLRLCDFHVEEELFKVEP
jgi:hypothetical protein